MDISNFLFRLVRKGVIIEMKLMDRTQWNEGALLTKLQCNHPREASMQKSYDITATSGYPLGVCFVPEGLHISAVCDGQTECGILLYDRKHKEGVKIPFPEAYRKGNVYSMLLKGYRDTSCSYLFYQGKELLQDPYARAVVKERKYGEMKKMPSRCKVTVGAYEWEGDRAPLIPFEESFFYLLHVRGFTKHKSSGVRAKGTYAGIVEKIPYLKELGITAVLLMPAYEFDETFQNKKQSPAMEQVAARYEEMPETRENPPVRVNYWGYQEGLYFLPKNTYAYSKDAITEFKDMVKALHQNGMEVMMQFYFPPTVGYMKILEILRHWVLEYHIDGFWLMGIDIPMRMLVKEPLFAETKLLGERNEHFYPDTAEPDRDKAGRKFRNFGYMNEAFLYDMRKFLKGDADMINSLIRLGRENAADRGVVNYIAKQDGFRLYDLVSYDRKHNEENGEQNLDGSSYNFSWNCGIEGKTRKKSVLALRMRQMKNAMTFVMLSQGTPLLYSGDEFANSQGGNNNPYCQDNSVCWIKWNLLKTNEALFCYVKSLASFRRNHPIFHADTPLRGMDYISCGYPDISYHGKEAWKPEIRPESRSIGILYCGLYGKGADTADDAFFYVGINMHWEPQDFGLPQMPKDKEWVRLFTTKEVESEKGNFDVKSNENSDEEETRKDETQKEETRTKETKKEEADTYYKVMIPPRTIAVYGTKNRLSAEKGSAKRILHKKKKQ